MSRYYYRTRDGEHWVRKSHAKTYTRAWQAARAARAERRQGIQPQQRTATGFIVKMVGGTPVLYDPGIIDRYLYTSPSRDG